MAVAVAYTKTTGSVMDEKYIFSFDQALTTSHISEDVVDLGTNYADGAVALGTGTPIRLKAVVTTAFAGGTSLVIGLTTAEDAAGASAYVLAATPAILEASLVKGFTVELTVPPGVKLDRYLVVKYTSVGTHSAGKITTFIDPN